MTTSIWQKIALVFLGLFLSLVLLEASLRLGGFVLLSIQEYGNLRSIKQKGAYRILCLGESTTQGQYPHLLEQVLNRRNIGVRFGVIDKGKAATETSAILSRVESDLTEFHPDMLVAMMGINDSGDHIPFDAATTSKGALFIQSFRTYKLTRLLWLHLLAKTRGFGFYKPDEDRQNSRKILTPVPKTGSKETSTEPPLNDDPSTNDVEITHKVDNAQLAFGVLYRDQGQITEAEVSFKKSIELDPECDAAYAELGWLYSEQGKFTQAEDFLRKAIKIDSENDHAYLGLGRLYRNQGKFPQAEDFYRKAIEIDPKKDFLYLELGEFYRAQNKFSQVEDLCKHAIVINPQNVSAFFALAGLYRVHDKLSEAEDLLRKAVEFNPENERLLGAIVSLYEEMGKPELAKEYAQKLRGLRSEDCGVVVVSNYRKLKGILDKKGIKLVCVQYPMRNVEPLKRIFEHDKGAIFVDNENIFKEAVKQSGYKEYFKDMFGGDFGHCTRKGNELLAQNIADVILREVFNK